MQKQDFPQIVKIIKTTPELSVMEEREYIGRKELNNLLKLNTGISIVAVEGKEVLGFAFGLLEPTNKKSAWLYHLAVKSKFHGRGLGSILLKAYESELKKRGVKIILLYYHIKPKLKEFYKKHNYKTSKTAVIHALKEL